MQLADDSPLNARSSKLSSVRLISCGQHVVILKANYQITNDFLCVLDRVFSGYLLCDLKEKIGFLVVFC